MRRTLRFLPRTNAKLGAKPLTVDECVALIDRAFTAGYAAAHSGKYLRLSKRLFLSNLSEELRQ